MSSERVNFPLMAMGADLGQTLACKGLARKGSDAKTQQLRVCGVYKTWEQKFLPKNSPFCFLFFFSGLYLLHH